MSNRNAFDALSRLEDARSACRDDLQLVRSALFEILEPSYVGEEHEERRESALRGAVRVLDRADDSIQEAIGAAYTELVHGRNEEES